MTEAKQKHLKGESNVVIPETEGWSYDLASCAEAIVKAEHAPNLNMEEMQKHTVEVIKKVHHEEYSVKTGPDVTGQPGVRDNLNHTVNDPEAKGHATRTGDSM